MRTFANALLGFALLAIQVRADYAFVQCAGPLLVTNLLTGLVNVVTTALSPANSVTGCPTYCQGTAGTTYSIWQPGIVGLLSNCYCTNLQPTAFYTTAGTNANGVCGIATYTINYLDAPADLLDFTGCTTGSVPGLGSPAAFQTTDADSCFVACQSYKYLIMTPNLVGTQFTCQCASFLTPGTSATCNRNVQNIYNNPNIAASGEAARKRRQLAMQKRLAENNSPCLRGSDACLLPGSAHAWECSDTSTDLENCGGCLSGYYDQPHRNATGVDCTVGAAIGGASCSKGVCKQWRCARGWVLEGERCVRKFGTNEERRRR
ncbi:hypothetical protein CC85DRAFT_7898 [Cutaneotrichosporon oleaginosum]|uniref:Protein CPL1-like domain-containing protein n=1 Tax=Cutaneotrichosporon oleaginosum TaxID=879819 RepID=A0A0J0XTV4_9TREE|nr:uncharacterized protein CC85DRAFT_7898 [Cutaneotrichosporon oleaginosum]KLT44513.1 hypothetical protein CC85DRAFT_7898 [Cutaneotrichosporon oleaginosum]TXT13970.1 hypothetical protein COLE_00163 [Cutaneotrichosporon oleaginosum]